MQNKTYISINNDKNSCNFNNVIINDTKIRDIEFNDCEFINVTINTELLNSSFIDVSEIVPIFDIVPVFLLFDRFRRETRIVVDSLL